MVLSWLVIINSGCNFVIYAWRSKDFRHAFGKIILQAFGKIIPVSKVQSYKMSVAPKVSTVRRITAINSKATVNVTAINAQRL